MAVASHSISHIAGLSVPPSVQSKQPRQPVRARAGPIRPSTRASAKLNSSLLPLLLKAPALQSSSLAGAHCRSRSRSRKGVSPRALPIAAAAAATAVAETKEQLEAKAERFWKWLVDQGVGDKDLPAAVKPVVLTAADGQPRLALVADRDIRSGDDLLLVPLSACLTLDKVLRTDIGAVCGDVRPWVALALFIIRERGNPTSEWAPYLDTLPTSLNSPLLWTDEELKMLEGTQVLALQQQYAEYIASEHQAALEAIVLPNPALFPAPERFSLAAFTWAFALLRARSFPPFSRDDVALVPLLDLVSHSTESPEGKWQARAVGGGLFSAGRDVVTGPAGRSYHKGQLITVNFGKGKSNAQLAIDHGIVDPPTITPAASPASSSSLQAPQQEQQKSGALGAIVNTVASGVNNVTSMVSVGKAVAAVEAAKVAAKAAAAAAATGAGNRDAFSLTLEIAESDRFFDDKADVAEQSGLEAVADFDIVAGQGVPDEMVAFLRLVALGGADAFLLEALFRNSVWDHLLNPVSRENEEAVCVGIVDSCAAALAAYPTTYEEDVALLPTLAPGSKEQVAVVVRMGEKAALGELQSWAVRRMRALDSLLYYAERRLSDLGLLDDTGNMTPWVGAE
ncbi:unnamed protein product [Closterium sp. Naga37s-1]|nr:unnamed protein product [Closterium sp. Naga37s-1]